MIEGLSGRKILVTGASGGIGSATAKVLLKSGAVVFLHYNSSIQGINEIKDWMEKEGIPNDHGFPVQADLSEEEQVIQMFENIKSMGGSLHGLVNNAGIWPPKDTSIVEMTLEQWNRTLAVNLTSMFLCSREFLRLLKSDPIEDASIVLIGSTAGIFGEAGHIDYSVTKSALHGFMLSLKNEIVKISRHGRVNTVSPGWVKTKMAEDGLKDLKTVTKVLQTTAMRKIATPNDIAYPVAFLLSPLLSGHISGQNIAVTGGMEGRLLFYPDEVDPANA